MPVQKFRTFDDASRAIVSPATTTDRRPLAARVAALWAFSAALTPPLGFRGVLKFRSIEEANEDRRRMTVERPMRRRR